MDSSRCRRLVYLSLSLALLCGFLMACGSQEAPKEAAKEKAPPASAAPAAPTGGATAPKTVEGYIGQGKEFLTAKQYDQAIVSFSEALKLNPQSVQALNNRGVAYCSKGNLDQAISDFSRTIELDPKNGKAYNNRAVAYFMKGEKDKARQDVEKAQSLGIAVNQMLIDSLKPAAAKGEAPPGKGPAPPAPIKPVPTAKPETKGKGEANKK